VFHIRYFRYSTLRIAVVYLRFYIDIPQVDLDSIHAQFNRNSASVDDLSLSASGRVGQKVPEQVDNRGKPRWNP
jgi:hypothetical protein